MIPDYRDPWRSYAKPDDGEPPARKRLSGMQVFWRGVPFVVAFWMIVANVPDG